MVRELARTIRRNYAKLLKEPQWHHFRDNVLEHYESMCFLCGSEDDLQIHHLVYYDRMPWDYSFDQVRVYCRNCHELVTIISDEIWVELQCRLPHELEQILKDFRSDEKIASRIARELIEL